MDSAGLEVFEDQYGAPAGSTELSDVDALLQIHDAGKGDDDDGLDLYNDVMHEDPAALQGADEHDFSDGHPSLEVETASSLISPAAAARPSPPFSIKSEKSTHRGPHEAGPKGGPYHSAGLPQSQVVGGAVSRPQSAPQAAVLGGPMGGGQQQHSGYQVPPLGQYPSTSHLNCSLYIGNLHWWTSDRDLEQVCSEFGRLRNLFIYYDKFNGKSKGYALVEFLSPEQAAQARDQLNGRDINGRPAVTNFDKKFFERQAPSSMGGGMHGGQHGGGGGGGGAGAVTVIPRKQAGPGAPYNAQYGRHNTASPHNPPGPYQRQQLQRNGDPGQYGGVPPGPGHQGPGPMQHPQHMPQQHVAGMPVGRGGPPPPYGHHGMPPPGMPMPPPQPFHPFNPMFPHDRPLIPGPAFPGHMNPPFYTMEPPMAHGAPPGPEHHQYPFMFPPHDDQWNPVPPRVKRELEEGDDASSSGSSSEDGEDEAGGGGGASTKRRHRDKRHSDRDRSADRHKKKYGERDKTKRRDRERRH